jgi:hypothetical protein
LQPKFAALLVGLMAGRGRLPWTSASRGWPLGRGLLRQAASAGVAWPRAQLEFALRRLALSIGRGVAFASQRHACRELPRSWLAASNSGGSLLLSRSASASACSEACCTPSAAQFLGDALEVSRRLRRARRQALEFLVSASSGARSRARALRQLELTGEFTVLCFELGTSSFRSSSALSASR